MEHDAIAAVLSDPVTKELMSSAIPGRLAYTGLDGGPRVVPIAFHWDGADLVMATDPSTPKVAALIADPRAALTIDTESQPPHVLLVRGVTNVEIVDGVPPEYLTASRKLIPAEMWAGFEANVHATYEQMALIRLTPTWAKVMDFVTRAPEFLERKAQSAAQAAG